MDRRWFGKLAIAAGAMTAGGSAGPEAIAQPQVPAAEASLAFSAELRPIFQQSYPRFSDAEYKRRHDALARVMERAGADHLLIVSAQNVGNATRWVTGWPGTNEALTIFRPGERMTMHVEYYNHVPQARLLARGVDVRWGEEKGIVQVSEQRLRGGARRMRAAPVHVAARHRRRRCRCLRALRGVVGLFRAGAARLYGGSAAERALPRSARNRGRRL